MEALRKEVWLQKHMTVIERIELLEEEFREAMDSHGKQRKEEMRKTVQMMLGDSAAVNLRIMFGFWVTATETTKKEKAEERLVNMQVGIEALEEEFRDNVTAYGKNRRQAMQR